MGLETGTFIDDLVATNPLGTDQKLQGDDHLRLIKSVLQATFPSADQAFPLKRYNTPAVKTGVYTVVAADDGSLIRVDATSGAIIVTLTAAATLGAKFLTRIKKIDGSANTVTVDANGAETIDGATTLVLPDQYDAVTLLCDGTAWHVLSDSLNVALLTAVNTFTKTQIWSKGADIASAATLVLGTDGNYFDVTGAIDITGITVSAGTFFMLQFNDVLTLTHGASLALPTSANIITAAGDILIGFATAANTVKALFFPVSGEPVTGILPEGYITDLTLSNNGTFPDDDLDIAAGRCRDAANTDDMVLSASITKQIDALWAVGTDAGGLDTGAVAADTVYAVWLIKRSDTDVVDALFSTSFSAPTMPTNYDLKRLIGFVVTDATSDIITFTQVGDYFRFTGDVIVLTDATITGSTFEVAALSLPPNCLAHIYVNAANPTSASSTMYVWVRINGAADATNAQEATGSQVIGGGGTAEGTGGATLVLLDSSSQLQYACAEGSGAATVYIGTFGCWMLTRSNP